MGQESEVLPMSMEIPVRRAALLAGAWLLSLSAAVGEDKVFSGPQPGEPTTPFKVLDLAEGAGGKERDPIAENRGAPTALVFVHGLERSLVPLLRVIDEYGAERKDLIRTEVVFLASDRLAGEERARAASRSLRLKSRLGLSLDGAEGPGNYGLNKECLLTIVAAKDDRATASFALVQPGFADAPRVLEALAAACGDASPPAAEDLLAKQSGREGGREARKAMRGEPAAPRRAQPEPTDLSRFDLETEAGLKDAVRALLAEVDRLRAEVADLRGSRGEGTPSPAAAERKDEPAGEYPGAVPSDPKLQGLLRRAIRPENDDAAVDELIAEMEALVKGNADLTRQAIDGWTRVLHFGERYGTPHARRAGAALLQRLKGG
jgi:hypothetical protein